MTSINATAMRTHLCGELRREHIGQTVDVCGWVGRRREHGEHLAFLDVRDHLGVVQCVVDNSIDVRSEYVVRVSGVVRAAALVPRHHSHQPGRTGCPDSRRDAEPGDQGHRDQGGQPGPSGGALEQLPQHVASQ